MWQLCSRAVHSRYVNLAGNLTNYARTPLLLSFAQLYKNDLDETSMQQCSLSLTMIRGKVALAILLSFSLVEFVLSAEGRKSVVIGGETDSLIAWIQ
jgi:hypothetical protein